MPAKRILSEYGNNRYRFMVWFHNGGRDGSYCICLSVESEIDAFIMVQQFGGDSDFFNVMGDTVGSMHPDHPQEIPHAATTKELIP